MIPLMLYTLAVTALFGAAAAGAERVLRLCGRQARWVWVVALAASLGAPVVGPRLGGEAGGTEARIGEVEVVSAVPGPLAAGAAEPWSALQAALPAANAVATLAWPVASALVLLLLLGGTLRLARLGRSWRRERLDGLDVLVSGDTGPAVVGLLRSAIVVPAWVLDEEPSRRALLLAHEREHARAGDHRLLAGALVALVLLPWNAPLWWMVRRLRLAVELDCDARVLRGRPDVRGYASLLLEVGRRASRGPLAAVAFSEPKSNLERRIRAMTDSAPKLRMVQVTACVAAVVALVAAACEVPAPTPAEPMASEAAAVAAPDTFSREEASTAGLTEGPVFTPYDVAPDLTNGAEVEAVLERLYTPMRRDAGMFGRVNVWVLVDSAGRVVERRINHSSGYGPLDLAAIEVVDAMRFRPARLNGRPVAVWVSLPVVFGRERTREESRELMQKQMEDLFRDQKEQAERLRPAEPGISDHPVFTPYTQAPELANARDVVAALEASYPPLLRDAGIGGTVLVWFFIDDSGSVARVLLKQSSGRTELDEAALRVAATMEFTPARNRGEPVAVWVALPISFRPGGDEGEAASGARRQSSS